MKDTFSHGFRLPLAYFMVIISVAASLITENPLLESSLMIVVFPEPGVPVKIYRFIKITLKVILGIFAYPLKG